MRPVLSMREPKYKDMTAEDDAHVASLSYEFLESIRSFDRRRYSVQKILLSLSKDLQECMYNALLFKERMPPSSGYIHAIPPGTEISEDFVNYINDEYKKLPYEARPDKIKKKRDSSSDFRHRIDKINEKRYQEYAAKVSVISKAVIENVFKPLQDQKKNVIYEPLVHKLTNVLRTHERHTGPSKIEYPDFIYDDILQSIVDVCNARLFNNLSAIPEAFEKRLDDLTKCYVPIKGLIKDFGVIADVWEWE